MAGLSFDSKFSNSAFLSAGIFSADAIADLVFSMCSSVIYAVPSYVLRSRSPMRVQRSNKIRLETIRTFENPQSDPGRQTFSKPASIPRRALLGEFPGDVGGGTRGQERGSWARHQRSPRSRLQIVSSAAFTDYSRLRPATRHGEQAGRNWTVSMRQPIFDDM